MESTMEAVCLEENLPVDRFGVVIANTLWCADITELKYCTKSSATPGYERLLQGRA